MIRWLWRFCWMTTGTVRRETVRLLLPLLLALLVQVQVQVAVVVVVG